MSRRRIANLSAATSRTDDSNHPHGEDKDSLIAWQYLHPWQKDNEFIQTSYRRASFDWSRSARSVFRIHNETVNIWSHGVGSVIWLILPFFLYHTFWPRYDQASAGDATAIAIFCMSVVVCFVLSSSFHTFLNHSPKVWRFTSQLDHLGIVLVIWGSTIPSDYFGFYCHPHLQMRYWALGTAFAAASSWATFQPVFRTPVGRRVRFLLYSALGVSAFIPAVHGVRMNGWETQNRSMSLGYFVGLGALNFSGAAVYAARVPERWAPGRFDVVGASHQIMHVLVICGAVSHSIGLARAFDYWNALKDKGNACTGQ